MNDTEREMWVQNDESLYNMWRTSRLSQRGFIRQNREFLDRAINGALNK